MKKLWLTLLLGAIFGGCFLWYSFSSTDASDWMSGLARVGTGPILLFLFIYALYFVMKSYRWGLILHSSVKVKLSELVSLTVMGYAGNLLIPHSGELLKTVQVRKNHGVSTAPVLASIAIERIFDLWTILLFSAVIFIGGGGLDSSIHKAGYFVLVLCLIVASIIYMTLKHKPVMQKLMEWVVCLLPHRFQTAILDYIKRFLPVLDVFRSTRLLFIVVIISILQWLLILSCIWLSLTAVGLSPTLFSAVALLLLTIVGIALPTAPGYVGTTQVCFIVVGGMAGWDDSLAIAASVFYNLMISVPVLITGAGFFVRSSTIRFSSILGRGE